MNQFELACAFFSAAAYVEKRSAVNQLTINPAVATRLSGSLGYRVNAASGFEASAFEYQGKIIISYAGTRLSDSEGSIDFLKDSWPDLSTDLILGLGRTESQLEQAAAFYADVKKATDRPADIVFTGHSLGGGLAALMAVYFDTQRGQALPLA